MDDQKQTEFKYDNVKFTMSPNNREIQTVGSFFTCGFINIDSFPIMLEAYEKKLKEDNFEDYWQKNLTIYFIGLFQHTISYIDQQIENNLNT